MLIFALNNQATMLFSLSAAQQQHAFIFLTLGSASSVTLHVPVCSEITQLFILLSFLQQQVSWFECVRIFI